MFREELQYPHIRSLKLQGYRPFKDFMGEFSNLDVIVGANGSGKSSLFEFLKFLRDGMYQVIPPEIVSGAVGQQIFHRPGPDRIWWSVEINLLQRLPLYYQGEIRGPIGQTHVSFERVRTTKPTRAEYEDPYLFMDITERQGVIQDLDGKLSKQSLNLRKPNQLALSVMTNPSITTLYNLREFIAAWRFYSAFNIDNNKIRKSVPVEQAPLLHEDGGNLSAVLFYLMTEQQAAFDELQACLRLAIPGFQNLTVKARGGPGEVIAFWQEDGVDGELSLADLSDGILRFLCWATLAIMPTPPTLICIDEPAQGIHPHALPLLAGLFEKASYNTQLLLGTHASYFLAQFDIDHLAVMHKQQGESKYVRPKNSQTLRANLETFGTEELELMHRSNALAVTS
ncbi:MAG: AAA family ATPase [Anaerolineae bacterium]|nr:AAA family ATPase [Anaerolineae bacterium]